MAKKEVQHRQEDKIGFLDFPRDVVAQTRQTAYDAYNKLAVNKVDIVAMNFEGSDYLNSAGIGLVISLVEDATQAGRKVFAYGLSSHYRKLFSMVGLTERLTLVANEDAMREKLGLNITPEPDPPAAAKPKTEPASKPASDSKPSPNPEPSSSAEPSPGSDSSQK